MTAIDRATATAFAIAVNRIRPAWDATGLRAMIENGTYVDQIKAGSGYADCGLLMPEHPEVFDFDHIDSRVKSANVSTFLTKGTMDDLRAEIAKCEVVCANCHRIRTRSRESVKFGRSRT